MSSSDASIHPGSGSALVDVHGHFLTDRYVAAARAAGHQQPDGMPAWPSWSAQEHLRLMDEWGIAATVLSISSPGVHFGDDIAARELARHVNDTGAGTAHAYPDRFAHFASLPLPDIDGSLAELCRAFDELGSIGVAVETSTGGVYLGDPRYEPLYAELDTRRAVVFVHPTSPPGYEQIALGRPRPMLEFIFDTARAVADLLFAGVFVRYPRIEWIIPHGGGALPLLADRIDLFRRMLPGPASADPTVNDQLRALWFDTAGTPFPRQVPTLAGTVGTEHLLYGSDYCWTPPPAVAQQIQSIRQAPPANGSWAELTTRNARRLFPHLCPGDPSAETTAEPAPSQAPEPTEGRHV